MNIAAPIQSEPSAPLIQAATVRRMTNRTAKFDGSQRLALPPKGVIDLSSIYPEAVVASSEPLGWQNLRAVEMQDTLSEWMIPPLENHCIIIQLGPSVEVSARIGDQNFEQRIEPGAITIVPAGLSMHWQQECSASIHTLQLYLDPNFLRTTAESMDVDHSQVSIAPQFGIRDEHIHHIGMSLHYELRDTNVIGRLYADSLAKMVAMQLIRRYSYLNDLQLSRGGIAPRKLRKALEFINENLDREQTVSVAALADTVQLSYSNFSRAFKQSMGVSPSVYMTEQRIERAKKLLAQTNLRIADIALQTGFVSQSHFTTTFRKLVWTTPKAFRSML